MKRPEFYFEVRFTSADFSVAELTAFAVDHEARLTSNNADGNLDALIAATATTLDEVIGVTGREQTARAIQKSRTAAKSEQLQTIRDTVSRQSGRISAEFGKSSPAYLEFFPRGLSEFHNAREAEMPGLLQRIVEAATVHLPELAPVFQKLLDDWEAVSGEAAARRAATGSTAQSRNEALNALRLQLTKNLLTLGLEHLDRPEMAGVFFNTSLLYNRQTALNEEPDDLSEAESPPVMA